MRPTPQDRRRALVVAALLLVARAGAGTPALLADRVCDNRACSDVQGLEGADRDLAAGLAADGGRSVPTLQTQDAWEAAVAARCGGSVDCERDAAAARWLVLFDAWRKAWAVPVAPMSREEARSACEAFATAGSTSPRGSSAWPTFDVMLLNAMLASRLGSAPRSDDRAVSANRPAPEDQLVVPFEDGTLRRLAVVNLSGDDHLDRVLPVVPSDAPDTPPVAEGPTLRVDEDAIGSAYDVVRWQGRAFAVGYTHRLPATLSHLSEIRPNGALRPLCTFEPSTRWQPVGADSRVALCLAMAGQDDPDPPMGAPPAPTDDDAPDIDEAKYVEAFRRMIHFEPPQDEAFSPEVVRHDVRLRGIDRPVVLLTLDFLSPWGEGNRNSAIVRATATTTPVPPAVRRLDDALRALSTGPRNGYGSLTLRRRGADWYVDRRMIAAYGALYRIEGSAVHRVCRWREMPSARVARLLGDPPEGE